MFSKDEVTKEAKKIKLSPPSGMGDCGYHVIILALLYLALKSEENAELAELINSNKSIRTLLEKQPLSLRRYLEKLPTNSNVDQLISYIRAMNQEGFDKLYLSEILDNFTSSLKQLCAHSSWLNERIQQIIKSGLWLETYPEWGKYKNFKEIMRKITLKADEFYELQATEKKNNLDAIYETIFNARISACGELAEHQLQLPVSDVISEFYLSPHQKNWLDSDFLKALANDLLGDSEYMFDKDGLMITSAGPCSEHWYIDLPNDSYSKKLIAACNRGYQAILSFVPEGTNCELSTVYSSFFSHENKKEAVTKSETLKLT